MKTIVLLGSTGSIGENTLRVVEELARHFRVAAIAVETNYPRALEQARSFGIPTIAVADERCAAACAREAPAGLRVLAGRAGLEEAASLDGVDIVVCAVVGMAGLPPVLAAVQKGTHVALATKEVLVAAGGIVTAACARSGAQLLPVDSEHSAIFQCLQGCLQQAGGRLVPDATVRRMTLTASGGPFASRPEIDLDTVTVEQALNHPRWAMGRKVTIDSATLMNKGLEIMEAHWLFQMPLDRIDVVLHPESIVHSLIEFVDGSLLAQMSVPDMRFAIQYALTYPSRLDGRLPPLDLAALCALHFQAPDPARFPCLALARHAARVGGTLPAVLNAANEVAVDAFLKGGLPFSGIWNTVENVMNEHAADPAPDLPAIFDADAWARAKAHDSL